MQAGGEVIDANRPDGLLEVKIARMTVTSKGVETLINNVLVKENDLSPISKKKGLVII